MVISSVLTHASLSPVTPASKQPADVGEAPPPPESLHVRLSAEARSLSQKAHTVDVAHVEALRSRMQAGRFSVDHLSLARSMLAQG
jgi:anti-sigma28 factor (negative regulator of flagellin synthesis)